MIDVATLLQRAGTALGLLGGGSNANPQSPQSVAKYLGYISGAGTPVGAVTPDHVGQVYEDTVHKNFWIAVDAGNGDWALMSFDGIDASYTAAASAVAFTAAGGEVSGGHSFVELDLTGNPAGAAALTLPTVAALVAASPIAVVAQTYVLRVKNSANTGTWTVTTNTGWTLSGTMAVATGTWREFMVTLSSLTTATLQNLGAGTL